MCIFKFLIKVLVVKIATQINMLKFIKFFHQFFFMLNFFFAKIFLYFSKHFESWCLYL